MVQGWLNKYYGARDYLQWCADQVSAGKYLQTPWGNRRRAGLVTKESLHALQNEFKNFPIQGSSSHLLLYSAIQVERPLRIQYDTTILNLIHDSILLEVPAKAEIIQAVSLYVSDVMVQAPVKLFDCDVPFKTDTDIGVDWGHVIPYNHHTQKLELDEDDRTKDVNFNDWLPGAYHYDIYQRPWYKSLKSYRD